MLLNLLLFRRSTLFLMAPLAALLLGKGLSADGMSSNTALMIFAGAIFVGWSLANMITGLLRGRISFGMIMLLVALAGPAFLAGSL